MKRIFFAVFFSIFACKLFSDEPVYLERYNHIVGPSAAMSCYVGSWSGQQNIFLPDGKLLMTFTVSQDFRWTYEDGKKILRSTGEVMTYGEKIKIFQTMEDKGEFILLEFADAHGEKTRFRGYVQKAQIVWAPEFFFMLPDIQTDMFFPSKDKIELFSENVKEVPSGRGYSGKLIIKTLLSKAKIESSFESQPEDPKAPRKGGFFLRGKGTLFD